MGKKHHMATTDVVLRVSHFAAASFELTRVGGCRFSVRLEGAIFQHESQSIYLTHGFHHVFRKDSPRDSPRPSVGLPIGELVNQFAVDLAFSPSALKQIS